MMKVRVFLDSGQMREYDANDWKTFDGYLDIIKNGTVLATYAPRTWTSHRCPRAPSFRDVTQQHHHIKCGEPTGKFSLAPHTCVRQQNHMPVILREA